MTMGDASQMTMDALLGEGGRRSRVRPKPMKPTKPKRTRTEWSVEVDDGYDYYADGAEAVVCLMSMEPKARWMYVMRRDEAVRFCERRETRGQGWMFTFTTRNLDWREHKAAFKADDGRFDGLLAELGIEPIFRVTAAKAGKGGMR